jgi:ABC-type Co2+ transport system permease subunit
MHIEPGIIVGAKMALSYGTAAAALGVAAKLAMNHAKEHGMPSLAARTGVATLAVFVFFEVFFHFPVGVSEVHLIFGTSLLLLLGVAPAAWGLMLGLLAQGSLFAPTDLPQYGANITTLLVPLFTTHLLARRIVAKNQAYVDLRYSQVLKLSVAYQGGIVAWVAFWAFYGQGISLQTLASTASFGAAYLSVILIEPVVDLGLLALAKTARSLQTTQPARLLLNGRLFAAAES